MSEQPKPMAVQESAAPPAEQITPMQMLQIAVDRGADLDQLQKLMDLQERWEANQARKAFTAALSAFKANPPTITKNKRAGFTSRRTGGTTEYDYLTLPEAVRVIAPALSQHGLSHNWSTAQDDTRVSVTCTLTHEKGHSESVTLAAPLDDSGSKNAIQAIGSTITYLERYTLLAITGLSADDMDDDGVGVNETITDDQIVELESRAGEIGIEMPKFLGWLGVEALEDLPASDFQKAFNAIEEKRRQWDKSKS